MLFEFLIKAFLQERKQLLFSCLQKVDHSFLHFHFIFAVHIWFISYTINTHFFHGNIWTQNLPAPNVSGFIAQLVEHHTGDRQVTGSNPVEVLNFFSGFFPQLHKLRSLRRSFLHFQKVDHVTNYWPTTKGLFRFILTFILDDSFFLLLFIAFSTLVYNVKVLNCCHFEIIFVFYGRCFQWMGRSSGCKPPVI